MKNITRRTRTLALAALMVLSTAGSAWAGCPPVDLDECTVMHQRSAACEAVEATIGR